MKPLYGAITALLISPLALAQDCPALASHSLSQGQIQVLRDSFEHGKPYGLSYSLAAIAWQESSAGVSLSNPHDPSAGAHGIMLYKVLRHFEMEYSEPSLKLAEEMLASNLPLSLHFSTSELQYWQGRHGTESWMDVWASYNAGNNWMYSAGQMYAHKIRDKITTLKGCNWV